ncbi:MAG: lysoplasmalogenase [Bacteroidetes bacterium]|nr:lysoplasmalogenase [Bacteroidota bacterium]
MKSRSLLGLFITNAIIDLFFVLLHKEELRHITKPLLLLFLIFYSAAGTKKKGKLFFLLLCALFFSFSGDVFLLFEKETPYWFILGLAGFLIAHIFYIALFIHVKKGNRPKKKINAFVVLLIAAYTTCLYLLLSPSLGDLKVPVLIYSIVLSCMFLAGIHTFDFSQQKFGRLCIIGAAFFVMSDSLLAINKFYGSFEGSGFLVMLTYDLAQLLIVLGITKYINLRPATTETPGRSSK